MFVALGGLGWDGGVSQQTARFGRKEGKELLGDDIRAISTVEPVAAETSTGGSGCVWLAQAEWLQHCGQSSCTLMDLAVCTEG